MGLAVNRIKKETPRIHVIYWLVAFFIPFSGAVLGIIAYKKGKGDVARFLFYTLVVFPVIYIILYFTFTAPLLADRYSLFELHKS